MKFGKALNNEIYEIPSEWRPFLIQYKHLKKCIHKIEHELNEVGMSRKSVKTKFKDGFKLEYSFKDDNNHVHTCINVDFGDHKRNSPKVQLSTFIHLTESSHSKCENDPISLCSDDSQCNNAKVVGFDDFMKNLPRHDDESVIRMEEVLKNLKKTLCVEREFFDILLEEISQLNHLQQINQEQFSNELKELRTLLIDATSPFKKDMYVWREIFDKYIFAEIFIGNTEVDRKERGWEVAQRKLNKFIEELNKSQLAKKLREPSSKIIFEEFLKLNHKLVTMKRFQQMNRTAMFKILKKHDKKSCLNASSNFQNLMKNDTYLNEKIFKSLCNDLTENLTSIIPQTKDYLCPVCMAIHWKPIRLCCGHVFCIQCLINAGHRKIKNCPICRAENAIVIWIHR
ncbi:7252_t:CDS:10 [Diversispora eburnea]|uniref:7252_t:CDS:1 n=1 Tax=Diversispora eburnea TaxID=1213867 RepID=A0A9N8V381_9GLOM|nr:7252_t:CDS:10 [Diversispora eburnea]